MQWTMQQASSYAGHVDSLTLLIAVMVFVWFFLVQGMFFWLLWRFRKREGVKAQYVTGEEHHLHRWITVPHNLIILCDLVIIAGAIYVWYEVKQDLPEPDETVRIVAQQWAWTFVLPGPDGQLDTDDDIATVDELHVEVDRTYHFQLESRDVLHSFSVPVFRLKQDAVPGRRIVGWFEPTLEGQYDVQCAEICGIGHGVMSARIFIESHDEHARWLEQAAHGAVALGDTPAAPAAD